MSIHVELRRDVSSPLSHLESFRICRIMLSYFELYRIKLKRHCECPCSPTKVPYKNVRGGWNHELLRGFYQLFGLILREKTRVADQSPVIYNTRLPRTSSQPELTFAWKEATRRAHRLVQPDECPQHSPNGKGNGDTRNEPLLDKYHPCHHTKPP
jgi:hypothetical protein